MVFFRRIFDERASLFPAVEARHRYVDATALDLIKHPWSFDVMVTETMYGDILSDLAAGLMGGLGMAPPGDRKRKRLHSRHYCESPMPSSPSTYQHQPHLPSSQRYH